MSDDVMAPVPNDHPLMTAWKAYKSSDDYRNSFKWAAEAQHREGSMWAAFSAGFLAISPTVTVPQDAEGERIAIEKAIRATEYKYFGDYEMSDDQREAVDQLVLTARNYLALTPTKGGE